MPPPPQTMGDGGVWQKVKMGAIMGSGVGLTIGFIFGSFSILRGGPGPRGALATLSQYMLSSAATFGFFMSIGSVIRTDSPYALPGSYSPTLVAAATSGSAYSALLAQRFRQTDKIEVQVMPLKTGAERWL
ncbi:subunit of TIM23 translocase complex [Naganishia albida]|nr:subunit of TIM23 translocase complex [Naganishia albida]